MTQKRYDWSQPVMSLLHKLQKAGVQIVSVNDGEGYEKVSGNTKLATRKDAADMITAVDEAWVRIQHQDDFATLFIVLGNNTNEILADYSFPPHTQLEEILEGVSEAFYEQWEDVPCPMV
jgi:hypothetical protein